MSVSGVKVISDKSAKLLEKAIADFIAEGNIVDDMRFSTAETKDGVLYSVALMVAPYDSLAQM